MRRFSLASVALLSLLGSVGCGGDDPIEPLADFRYTLGCGSRLGCLSKDRDINAFNGEGGTIVTCNVGTGASGSTLNFNLSALDPLDMRTRFGFEVRNVAYDAASGSPVGATGRVTVSEGSNRYSGTISANPPSLTAPCQLRSIAKTMDDVGNPQIEGDILCGAAADQAIGLEQSGVPTEHRDIHDPASGTTAAHFRIVLCGGLPIPE